MTHNTRFGGIVINTIALQARQPSLSFLGVGSSGMSLHHGIERFGEFSILRG